MKLHGPAIAVLVASIGANVQGSTTITGTATYRERIALPPNAIFEAMLQDISRADAPATVIGTVRLDKPGQPPFRFSISYDPAQIVESHSYAVRAQVMVEGKLMFTTTQAYPVLTRGKGTNVDMLLQRVSTPPSPKGAAVDSPLRETYWKLLQVEGKPIVVDEQQREPSIILHTEQDRVSGFGGCNSYAGTYAVDGTTLTFSGAATTLRACLKGMDIETALNKALSQTRTYKIVGDRLDLLDKSSKLLARFQAVALR